MQDSSMGYIPEGIIFNRQGEVKKREIFILISIASRGLN